MINVGTNKASLLLDGGIIVRVARPWFVGIVVVVAPFREVVCEFQTRGIGGCVLEVDDYELFVCILREEKGTGC